MSDLDPNTIVDRTLEQLQESEMLGDLSFEDGSSAWVPGAYEVRMWPHWRDSAPLVNTQKEQKISCNSGTWEIAPEMLTNLNNVFVGSIVMKSSNIVSQEQACTNGRLVASEILKRLGHKRPRVFSPDLSSPLYLSPLRLVDRILYFGGFEAIKYTRLRLNAIVAATLVILVYRLKQRRTRRHRH